MWNDGSQVCTIVKKSALKETSKQTETASSEGSWKWDHGTIKEGAAVMVWSLTKSLITSVGPLEEIKLNIKKFPNQFSLLKLPTQ